MKNKKIINKVLSFVLSGALTIASAGSYGVLHHPDTVKAFPAGATISEDKDLTETDIKDPTLLKILRVLANYTKAKKVETSLPELTGSENLLSSHYEIYQTGDFTFGELKAYTGPIDLTLYEGITSIEGLGYARGASCIDISTCSTITSIPANEFGKCALKKIIMSDKITSIGSGAFQQCSNLTQFLVNTHDYPGLLDDDLDTQISDLSDIKTIGANAFDGCTSMNNVKLMPRTDQNEVSIGSNAFQNCSGLTGISIPVVHATNIGEGAFAGCKLLETIELEDSLNYIPANVFSDTAIQYVKLFNHDYVNGVNKFPSSLTYIGDHAFQDSRLSSADFTGCKNLSTIGKYSFAATYSEEILLPSNLKDIQELAFNAACIPNIDIPDSVTTLGKLAFRDSLIVNITVSAQISNIEEETFCGSKITKIHFNNTDNCKSKLDTIGKAAFEGCKYLKTIELSKTPLSSIGDSAFKSCISLNDTSFLLDLTKLTTIGASAFASCSDYNAEKIDTDGDGKLDGYDKNIYGEWNYYGIKSIQLPNCVTTLGDGVFSNNYSLREANLGSGVTILPEKAFALTEQNYSKLDTVILPEKLNRIMADAFKNNCFLRTIGYTDGSKVTSSENTAKFGNYLIYIGNNAFSGCSSTHIINNINQKSTKLQGRQMTFASSDIHTDKQPGDHKYLVYYSGDHDFSEVYINFDNLTEIGTYTQTDSIYVIAQEMWYNDSAPINKDDTIKEYSTFVYENRSCYSDWIANIPKKSYNSDLLYDTAQSYCTPRYIMYCGTNGISGESGTTITAILFSGLKNVILPDSLTDTESGTEPNIVKTYALGEGVFKSNPNLESVSLSAKMTTLPKDTFNGCASKLSNWITGKEIPYIYKGLESVTNMTSLKDIVSNAFYNCYNFNLPQSTDGGEISNSLETIGDSAFYNCKNLTSVVFHSSLKSIGTAAFKNCAELETEQTELIDKETNKVKYRFYELISPDKADNNGLTDLDFTYATSLNSIGAEAFSYTAVKIVNLPKALYTDIPDKLFYGCEFLETMTIPENVTSIENSVFTDCQNLKKLHLPAAATIKGNILTGFTPAAIPGLQMIVSDNNTKLSVPTNNSLELPIKCMAYNHRSESYTVTVYEGKTDTTGTIIYSNGQRVENTKFKDIVNVSVTGLPESDSDVIALIGGKTPCNGLIVKVQATSAFRFDVRDGSIINSQTFIYNVDVSETPAKSLTVSCIDPVNNPGFNILKNASNEDVCSLYMNKNQTPVTLSSLVDPANTSDICEWTINDTSIADITVADIKDGRRNVTIKPKAIGSTYLTVKCGKIEIKVYLYVKVPATSISASTGSTVSTSNEASFDMPVDGTEKINVKVNYDNRTYSVDDWNINGDVIAYKSSDEKIVTVDAGGNLKAIAQGTAVVTATAMAGNKTVKFTINVVKSTEYNPLIGKNITAITGASNINVGQSIQLGVIMDPVRATNGIVWAVTKGDATITASGLLIAGSKPGDVVVKATMLDAGGLTTKATASITIKVLQSATAINLTQAIGNQINMYTGSSFSLTETSSATSKGYNLVPSSSTDEVTCTTTNAGIATVDTSSSKTRFSIAAKAQGSATIVLKATSGVTTSFVVNVTSPITNIKLNNKMIINKGQSIQLTPEITPATSADKLTWTSNKNTVAIVNETGIVTAVGKGTARITVKSASGKSAYCDVTVNIPSTKITVKTNTNLKKLYMAVGTSCSIACKINPIDTTDTVKFTSSKPKVATVSGNGTTASVSAKKKGTTKITMKTSSGKKATITIKVVKKAKAAKKVKLSGKKTVKVGSSINLTAKLTKSTSTDLVTWISSNSSKAKVDAYGCVTGCKKGTVKITAKASSGKSKTIKIKVKK